MKLNSYTSAIAAACAAFLIFAALPAGTVWAAEESTSEANLPEGAQAQAEAAGGEASGADMASLSGSYNNFRPQNNYSDSTFTDVSDSDWFAESVTECYLLGLISGKPGSRFDPYDSVSVAEAISMAARSHAIYYDLSVPESTGSEWYSGVVEYALAYGIIENNTFSNYQRPATRAELAYLFHNAFAQAELRILNNVTALPDVTGNTPYYEAIYKLYNIGVLSGKDEYGAFYPGNDITRGETAVLLARLTVPNRRQKLTLTPFESTLSNSNFTSDDGLYSLTASIDWSASSPRGSALSTLEVETYPTQKKITGFTVAKSTLEEWLQTDLYSYCYQFASDVSANLKSGQIHSTDNLTLNNRNGYLSHVTGKDPGSNIQFYYWIQVVDQGDHFIILTACTAKDSADKASAELLEILSSLQTAAPAVNPVPIADAVPADAAPEEVPATGEDAAW